MDNQTIIEEIIKNKVTGEVQVRKYKKGRFIGKIGNNNFIELTCVDTNKVSIAKIIDKTTIVKQKAKQRLENEMSIHRSLQHSGILTFEHSFETTENVYILLERCDNLTLFELLKRRVRLTELETMSISMQIVKSLKYLKSVKLINRNIKLSNLFISGKMEVKIGDFSCSEIIENNGRSRTIYGNPDLMAPETLDGNIGQSYEVDIWYLGVVMYTLLVGKQPFEALDLNETYKRIKANDCTFPNDCIISNSAKNLIKQMLNCDPQKRPTLDQILSNGFFNNGNFPDFLPEELLENPPTLDYIRQFLPNADGNDIYPVNNDFNETFNSISTKETTNRKDDI